MNKEKRIEYIIKNEQVTKISETDKFEYWLVKGISKKVYEIIYFKDRDDFTCHCGNIRNTTCYHIEAVKQKMGYHNEFDDVSLELK